MTHRSAPADGVTLRVARAGDHTAIAAVLDDWWGGRTMRVLLPPLFLQHFAGSSLVAEDVRGLAGFLVGFRSPDRPDVAYVHFAGVRPDLRRAGLGGRLYDRFAAQQRPLGVTELRAVTSPVNHGSLAFHRAYGFSLGSVVEDYDGPGEARVPMVLRLPADDDRPAPVSLIGHTVRLEPLGPQHVPDLTRHLAGDDEVWRWLPVVARDEADVTAVVQAALAEQGRGSRLPFAVVDLASGEAVGTTSYLDPDPANGGIEVGWTVYARDRWGGATNPDAKLLLLGHAFDSLGLERVQLKTHHRNTRSQAAIERLGATREGVLRHHRRHWDGTWRDSVVYSLLAAEWPVARTRLVARLAEPLDQA